MKSQYLFDKIIQQLCCLYFILPILIFFFGWLKLTIAVSFSLILLWGWLKSAQAAQYRTIHLDSKFLFLFLGINLVLIIWLYLSGIGGYSLQNWDFHGRNALFHDLINYAWPVRYDYASQPDLNFIFGTQGVLVYYFLYFLPAALVGKIEGWQAANFSLFMWTLLGLNLFIYLLFRYIKKANLGIIFVFIFFSGMDFLVSQHLYHTADRPFWTYILNSTQIDNWAVGYFEYSSITTQLYYVFNQSLPTWIITIWLLNQKNRKNILFLFSFLLFYAPLPSIGLFPFVVYKCITLPPHDLHAFRFHSLFLNFYHRYKDLFTFQNIICATLLFSLAYLFFSTIVGNHPYGMVWTFQPGILKLLLVLVVFYLIEFLILGLLLFPFTKDKGLLKVSLLCLISIPFFHYGVWNDFVMRASIPALLVLNIFIIQFLFTEKERSDRKKLAKIFIILCLLTGAITPLHLIYRPIEASFPSASEDITMDSWKTFGNGGYLDKMETIQNFVVRENTSKLFFQYLIKPDS